MRLYTIALLLQSVSFSVADLANYQLPDIQDSQKSFNCLGQVFGYRGLKDYISKAKGYISQGLLYEITIPEIEARLGNLPHESRVMYKSSEPDSKYYQLSIQGDGEGSSFYTYVLILDSHGHLSAILWKVTTVQSVATGISVIENFCTISQ
ncbi:unnamed protein product [Blumeria hordei]|uniref:Uncharacterized protein n=2 Tax=Blumeria hordei TaxID=2867405 RepID=A0A383UN96_BLUHO|nr:CSEP0068 putative effector protein [Blumeria hordei DH14]SZF01296.1 unnamed protein product [Blumeria hordei]